MKKDQIFEELQQHSIALARIQANLDNHLEHHKKTESIRSWLIPTIVSTIISLSTIFGTIFLR